MRILIFMIVTQILFAMNLSRSLEVGAVYNSMKSSKYGNLVEFNLNSKSDYIDLYLKLRNEAYLKSDDFYIFSKIDGHFKFLRLFSKVEILNNSWFLFKDGIGIFYRNNYIKTGTDFFYKYLVTNQSEEYDVKGIDVYFMLNWFIASKFGLERSLANSRDDLPNLNFTKFYILTVFSFYKYQLFFNFIRSLNTKDLTHINSGFRVTFNKVFLQTEFNYYSLNKEKKLLIGIGYKF